MGDNAKAEGCLSADLAGINHIAFSQDGSQMALSRTDMSLELFLEGTFTTRMSVGSDDEKVRPTERIRGLAFGPKGDRLIAASADWVLCIPLNPSAPQWSVQPARAFGFLVVSPLCISVSESGLVAASFDDGSIGTWTEDGICVFQRRESNAPRSIDISADDRELIGTDGFSVCSWDARTGKPRFQSHLDSRTYISAYWREGSIVAVRTLDSVIGLDAKSGRRLWTVPTLVGMPTMAFDQRRGRLAYSSERRVDVVDAEGQSQGSWELEGGAAISVAFHPRTGLIAVGKADGRLQWLDVAATP
jgi:WD40 repeat protein